MFDLDTLIRQLGTALPMLGARDLVAIESGLQFKIQGCPLGNKLRILLSPFDLYTVQLWKIRGADARLVEARDFVHADQLHRTIEALTGLRTRL